LAGVVALSSLTPLAHAADDERRSQELTFPELPDRFATDAPFEVTVTATSGLPVALTLVSGPALLDGRTLRLIGTPGVVILRATQPGNASFRPAVAERAFTVRRAAAAPNFTTQPSGCTAGPGETVTLTADATGSPAPTYQWRKDGLPIAGATGRMLTLSAASPADAGTYDVVAANESGAVASAKAVVVIGKRQQTINFQLGFPNCIAGQSVTLTAYATSGLTVGFAVISGSATLSGNVLMTNGTGTVTVRASQDGDSTFAAATPVDQTLFVSANPNPPRNGP
jgi:hypothetical protein